MRFPFVLALLLIFTLGLLVNGSGTTITVDDYGGEEVDYDTIQDALNASEDGDTIRVMEGTYFENIVINRSVSIVGFDKTTTVINGGGKGDVVNITNHGVTMRGFTIDGNSSSSSGIRIDSHNGTMIHDVICMNNKYGIYFSNSTRIVLQNTSFHNNSRTAVLLVNITNSVITNNTFLSNDICSIYLNNGTENIISNNEILYPGEYGIILRYSTKNSLTDNILKENQYGIYIWLSEYNRIQNNSIRDCNDGIYFNEGYNNTIANNSIDSAEYAIYLRDSGGNTVFSNTIISNKYGIITKRSEGNEILSNICLNNSYGIYIWKSAHNSVNSNNCSSNSHNGISLLDSRDIKIRDNNCSDNRNNGIQLIFSRNTLIENNIISFNEYGVFLRYEDKGSKRESNNTILNNTFHGNRQNIRTEVDAELELWMILTIIFTIAAILTIIERNPKQSLEYLKKFFATLRSKVSADHDNPPQVKEPPKSKFD